MKKNGLRHRILAISMTALMAASSLSTMPVMAAGSETAASSSSVTQTTNQDVSQKFDSSAIKKEDADKLDFSSTRLIVGVKNASDIVDPDQEVSHYENTYLMQYNSADAAKNAYSYYKAHAEYVSPDTKMKVADKETAKDSETEAAGEATEATPSAENTTSSESKSSEAKATVTPEAAAPAAEEGTTENTASAEQNNQKDDAFSELADALEDPADVDQQKTIAVIDTGMSGSNVVDAVSMIGDATADDNGHGTRSMNAILSENKNAKIISIKALDKNGFGETSAIYAGIQYAEKQKANYIVLPLYAYSTEENAALAEEIKAVIKNGITVIGAAGNDNADVKYYIPGNINEALIVGACDEKGNRITSSNYGDTVDYNVTADSTSEASAKMAGFASTVKGDLAKALKEEAAKKTWLFETSVSDSKQAATTDPLEDAKLADKTAVVKYLYVDSSKVAGDTTIDSTMDENQDAVLTQVEDVVPVYTKDGKYQFKAGAPWENGFAVQAPTDYVFARANDNGEVITDGVSYDPETKVATVDPSAMEKKDGDFADIQFQILVLANPNAQVSIPVTVEQKGKTVTKLNVSQSPYSYAAAQLLFDKTEGLSKDDFTVYINDAADPISSDEYTYDADQHMIGIYQYAMGIGSIRIVVADDATTCTGAASIVIEGSTDNLTTLAYLASDDAIKALQNPNDFKEGAEFDCGFKSGIAGFSTDMPKPTNESRITSNNSLLNKLSGSSFPTGSFVGMPMYIFGSDYNGKTGKMYKQVDSATNQSDSATTANGDSYYNIEVGGHKYLQYPAWTTKYGTDAGYNSGIPIYCHHVRRAVTDYKNTVMNYHVKILKRTDTESFTYICVGFESYDAISDTDVRGINQAAGGICQFAIPRPTKKEVFGSLQIQKDEMQDEMVTGNAAYQDLSGAVFGIYTDSSCTDANKVAELTTGADGKTPVQGKLKPGIYYVKELQAPTSGLYELNSSVKWVYVKADEESDFVYTVNQSDFIYPNPLNLTIKKKSSYSASDGGMVEPSLEGTQFSISYYNGFYDESSLPSTPTRKWTVAAKFDESSQQYIAQLDPEHLIDKEKDLYDTRVPIYFVRRGQISDLLLTTSYEEALAVTNSEYNSNSMGICGYRTTDTSGTPVYRLCLNGTNHYYTTDLSTVKELMGYGWSAEFQMENDDLNTAVPNFYLPNDSSEEKAPVYGAKNPNTGMYYMTPSQDEANLLYEAGWERQGDNGVIFNMSAPRLTDLYLSYENGTPQAIVPNGTVVVEETQAAPGYTNDANFTDADGKSYGSKVVLWQKGKQLVVASTGNTLSDTTLSAKDTPETFLKSELTGKPGHILPAGESVKLKDKVKIENVGTQLIGNEVTISGELYDADTQQPLVDVNGNTITATRTYDKLTQDDLNNGLINEFTFNTKGLEGKQIVAFETVTMKNAATGETIEVASHRNIGDKNQTVSFPKIGTTAKDASTQDHLSYANNANGTVSIVDTVIYQNLEVGKEYTMNGRLIDASTGKPFKNKDGEAVTASVQFTPTTATGSVDVPFTVAASDGFEGSTVVVYESVTSKETTGTVTWATHEEKDDEGQSIHFPKIGTTALADDTQKYGTNPDQIVHLTDTVMYTNLIPGKTYTVSGLLMDKESGKVVTDKDRNQISAEQTFTATNANGSVEIPFTFDGSNAYADGKKLSLGGTDIVAFETMKYRDSIIAVHRDPNDENQMISFPKASTSLRDYENSAKGTQYTPASKDLKLTDTVTLQNAKAFKDLEVTVRGKLKDQETGAVIKDKDGKEITAETKVTIDGKKTQTVKNVFAFDGSSLGGRTVVATEEVYFGDVLIAAHDNLHDTEQMMSFPKIGTTARDSQTNGNLSYANGTVKLIDTVTYTGLNPKATYTMEGTLMDKATGKAITDKSGKKVVASKKFTASDTGSGTVEVTFQFEASDDLAGKDGVIYEKAMKEDLVMATHENPNDTDQTIHFPKVGTTATSSDTGNHGTMADDSVTINDSVHYSNVVSGKSYTITGYLVDKETGKALTDADGNQITASDTFTADGTEGDRVLTFTFDSTKVKVDGKDFKCAGKDVVAFETLYDEHYSADDKTPKNPIAHHEDTSDGGQTIHFPTGHTNAVGKETGAGSVAAAANQTIVDTVTYENLLPNHEYSVTGTLMVKPTGDDLKTAKSEDGSVVVTRTDANGNQIRAEINAEETSATAVVTTKNDVYTYYFSLEKQETGTVQAALVGVTNGPLAQKAEATKDTTDETAKAADTTSSSSSVEPSESKDTSKDAEETASASKDTYTEAVYEALYAGLNTSLCSSEPTPLLDAEGKPVTKTVTFTTPEAKDGAQTVSGSVDIEFTVDASMLRGRSVVAFEDVKDGNITVLTHADINDTPQTIFVPGGHTTLVDDKTSDHMTKAEEKASVTDVVSYWNLLPETEYTVSGKLMDQKTGEPLKDDGKEVTATTTFTTPKAEEGAQSVSGEVELHFTFNASALGGSTLVAYEDMEQNGKTIFVHHEINDRNETTYVPTGKTTLTDTKTGNHTSYAEKETTLTDTVTFENLIPNKTYTVKGTLMDKETGKALQVDGKDVTAERTFTIPSAGDLKAETTTTDTGKAETTTGDTAKAETAKSETVKAADSASTETTGTKTGETSDGLTLKLNDRGAVDGSVTLTFTFDASALAGKTVVAFEDMQHKGISVFTHADINDEAQSVEFPKVRTKAVDKADGDQVISGSGTVSIVDTVTYTNLTPGTSYTMNGTLMDKGTKKAVVIDGKPVTGTATFTPDKKDGTVQVTFTFDAGKAGNGPFVVFEQAVETDSKVVVATHEDLNDKDQTLTKTTPKTTHSTPGTKTGVQTDDPAFRMMILLLVIGCGLLAAGLTVWFRRKRN